MNQTVQFPLGIDSEEGITTALTIRGDRSPAVLRKLAKAEADTRVARRLLAIANVLSGMSRKEAAEAAGMDRQTLIGQKGRVCHIWWKRGERPPGLCDKRFTFAYIFAGRRTRQSLHATTRQ